MQINSYLEKINSSINNTLTKPPNSNAIGLYQMMAHHISSRINFLSDNSSNRFNSFGVLCLTSCDATGGDWKKAVPAAMAIEFINGFLEIHDDVAHGNPNRESTESIWWKWGPAQAINAGDAMHSMARLAIFNLRDIGISDDITFEVLSVIDNTCLKLCETKFYELDSIDKLNLDIENYIESKRSHHSYLYECGMLIGSIISDAPNKIRTTLSQAGLELGTSTTISNEIKLFWDMDNQPDQMVSELLNKKKVLPVIYAFATGNANLKRRLGEIYLKRVLEPKDIISIKSILDEENSKEYCENLLSIHINKYNTHIDNCDLPKSFSQMFKNLITILTDEKYF